MSSTHHISRLQYRVSCPDEGQAFELRQMLSNAATTELTDVMQSICDHHVREGHFVRIPKIEISLETASLNGLTEELALKFGDALEKELRRLHEQTRDKQYEPAQEIDALLYYLRHGFLPRWAILLIRRVYDIAAVAIQRAPKRLLHFLYAHLHDYKVWERMRTQFSLEVTNALIGLMPELSQARETLNTAWTEWYTGDNIARIPWGSDEAAQTISEVVLRDAQDILLGKKDSASLFEDLMIRINHVPDNIPGGGGGMIKRPQMPVAPSDEAGVQEPDVEMSLLLTADAPDLQTDAVGVDLDEKLNTHTSGIILLHPFLKPFFTELGLLWEGDWKDEPSRQRAIHLLHFLATGRQEQGEWNLLLEKLMCGLTPDFPIERRIALTDEEVAECNGLLNAVIEHWAALKKTSPRALQETFLKRDGLLLKTDGGWQLQTERKTEDVLLEALPWNYSMIKMPWNEYLIEVLW